MAKKKRNPKTFKSIKQQDECFDFIDQHMQGILDCADLSHWIPNKKTLNVAHLTDEAMSIPIEYNYFEFDLNVNSEFISECWEKKQHHKIIRYLCHEMAHLVVEEIDDRLRFDKKHESKDVRYYMERATEHTSRWLYHLYCYWMKEWDVALETGKSPALEKLMSRNRKKNFK